MAEKKRLDWNEYFLKIAFDVAQRGTCKIRVYGAVVVDPEKRIVSTGYCGNPSGTINCCEIDGPCHRELSNTSSGKNYDKCHSIHAEENAIMNGGRDRVKGCDLYIAGQLLKTGAEVEGKPCIKCMERIVNAGLNEVITQTEGEIKRYLVEFWKGEIKKEIVENYAKVDKPKKDLKRKKK